MDKREQEIRDRRNDFSWWSERQSKADIDYLLTLLDTARQDERRQIAQWFEEEYGDKDVNMSGYEVAAELDFLTALEAQEGVTG